MITTYVGLQNAISCELNRKDLDEKTPLWVQLAEARMRRDLNAGRGHEPNIENQCEFISLSDGTRSNFILEQHPDIYFYGSLLHSAPYLDDDARLSTWSALYDSAVSRFNQRSNEFPANTDECFLQMSSSHPCVREDSRVGTGRGLSGVTSSFGGYNTRPSQLKQRVKGNDDVDGDFCPLRHAVAGNPIEPVDEIRDDICPILRHAVIGAGDPIPPIIGGDQTCRILEHAVI